MVVAGAQRTWKMRPRMRSQDYAWICGASSRSAMAPPSCGKVARRQQGCDLTLEGSGRMDDLGLLQL